MRKSPLNDSRDLNLPVAATIPVNISLPYKPVSDGAVNPFLPAVNLSIPNGLDQPFYQGAGLQMG
jgi:hypothetical protein